MGHYLIILAQDYSYDEYHRGSDDYSGEDEPATLLAVDLRDNTVQEAKIKGSESMFNYIEKYTFTKYKDNQIIKFGGEMNSRALDTLIRITVKSFQRIPYLEKKLTFLTILKLSR